MVDWVARDLATRKEHICAYAEELRGIFGEDVLMGKIKEHFGGFPGDSRELHNFLAGMIREQKEKA